MEEGLLSSYAGLFFLGIFLGLTFLVATILIIYYKQVSEGLQEVPIEALQWLRHLDGIEKVTYYSLED